MLRRERTAEVLRKSGLVKICGLRSPVHAAVAAEAGADLISFMFAPSKRRITLDQARLIVSELRGALGDRTPLLAGVFLEPDLMDVREAVSLVGLDIVQLHGPKSIALFPGLDLPVMSAFAPSPGTTAEESIAELERRRRGDHVPALFLLDTWDPVSHGGTGTRGDWALAHEIAAKLPVMLAGGLTPDNVGEAIRTVSPRGVDVSSGVETNGQKDPALIRAFVSAARTAFGEKAAQPAAPGRIA